MAIFNFFRETKNEMKHVNWPTRKKTIKYTLVVVVVSLILAITLGAFDALFIEIINLIVN